MKNILVSTSSFGKVDKAPLDLLVENGFNVTLNPHGKKLTVDQSLELLEGKTGLIAGTEILNAQIFDAHPQLEYICRLGVGMDAVDQEETKKRGIIVENTPSAHVDAVAELCLAGILDLHREVSSSHKNLTNNVWKKPMGRLLAGKKIGLLGLGQVSKRLIQLLQPFNVSIQALDPYWDEDFAAKNAIEKVDFRTLFIDNDIVSLHLPFTQENKYIVSEEQLQLMKPNAMLVNTSRGGLVQEDHLLDHLQKNPLFSAYLDTYENEPYNGNLTQQSNILVTPHIGSYAREVRINMETECAEKIIKFYQ